MAIVAFDAGRFKQRYPEFAAVSDAYLSACFNEAGLYLSNTDCSIVQDVTRREILLWMLTAHIAYLSGALNPGGIAGGPVPVGRTSSATEGSVSVSFDYSDAGTPAWYQQSQWGIAFWQATLSLRMFRYRPRATVIY